ncbi:MAG TPA: Yip1 family protein [Caulobacteraceae bacterium]|nr:Yip1 family protein [Caulobacteraceae bacterium]
MTVAEGPGTAGLVARVQNILLRPAAEWDLIAAEPATTQGLFAGYACWLAAIPAIASVIGGLFPVCLLGVCIHLNPVFVIVGGLVNYAISLVGVYVVGLIIDALAPTFGGESNRLQAMKVAVYSFTAAWLAGVFAIFPPLAALGILGLYSLYLLYIGLPRLMRAPQDKALGYTAVSLLLGILVFIVAGAIGDAVRGFGSAVPGVTIG